MQEFRLKDAGYRIRYHDFPGEGTPILFIHGLGCAGSFDYPQVAAQPELCGHRRILVDLLGSGFSDKPDDFSYAVHDHAAYLLDFVTSLGLEKLILFGHSLGGAVALSLAALCEERLERIILSESNLDPSGEGSTTKAIASYEESAFLTHGYKDMCEESQTDGNSLWAASFAVSSPRALYWNSRSAAEGQSPSCREILYALKCPRTFIFGARSLPDEQTTVLAQHGIHIEIVPDAGHSMAWENPQGLAAAIRNGILHD